MKPSKYVHKNTLKKSIYFRRCYKLCASGDIEQVTIILYF